MGIAFKVVGMLGLQGLAAFAVLNLSLVLLDCPSIDSFPAPHVKKLRYPSRYHVYRDEDYSRYFVNSFGLVGREPTSLANRSVYRIAVFGDSLVEAFQVAPEEKFTELLEHMITPPVGYGEVEVWNFGFSGDNTGNGYARWLYQAKPLRFDLVLFTFNDTDVIENRPEDVRGQAGAFLVEQSPGRMQLDESRIVASMGTVEIAVKAWFGRFFYSTYTVKNRVVQYVTDTRERWRAKIGVWGGSSELVYASSNDKARVRRMPSREMINHTCAQLAYVREQISAAGSVILLVGLPSGNAVLPEEVANDPFRHDAYIAVTECLQSVGVPFVDAYPVMAAETSELRDPYSSWDPGAHLNRLGHRLLAEVVSASIMREGAGTRLSGKD